MTLDEVKAYLRIDGDGEDAALETMIAAARGTCEAFLGGPLVRREVTATVAASGCWQRLDQAPVHAITRVEGIDETGSGIELAADRYAIDIDAGGEGWVRGTGAARIRVTYEAGISADTDGVPSPVAMGVTRLAAHLHGARESGAAPPASITALWRPWRRLRIEGGPRCAS